MSWYRTGTVTVATGSKNVTGVGTLWASSVNVGDAFALVDVNGNPTGAWYEVEEVTSNTALVLKQTYTGTPAPGSNKQYAVFNLVGNMTTPSFAQRLAQFFDQFQNLVDLPTTTPTASSIPIADSGGKIAGGWLPAATTSAAGASVRAAVSDVTTGTDDAKHVTPAGALALLRKFGLGAERQDSYTGEANNLTTSGIYIISSLAAGFPSTGVCLVQVTTAQNIQQWFMPLLNDEHRLFVRNRLSGTWGDWCMIAAPLLGTVSQSSGVPTGAVIERGSNANGEYVRFADGTQICVVRFTDFPSIQAGGTVPGTTNKAWTFPAEFTPSVSIAVSAVLEVSSAHWFTGFSISISTNSVTLRLGILATTQAPELPVRAMAIGRWF